MRGSRQWWLCSERLHGSPLELPLKVEIASYGARNIIWLAGDAELCTTPLPFPIVLQFHWSWSDNQSTNHLFLRLRNDVSEYTLCVRRPGGQG